MTYTRHQLLLDPKQVKAARKLTRELAVKEEINIGLSELYRRAMDYYLKSI